MRDVNFSKFLEVRRNEVGSEMKSAAWSRRAEFRTRYS